jgi:RimK family alpha-L-glutamate ligase
VDKPEIWIVANLELGPKFQDQATLVAEAINKEGLHARVVDSLELAVLVSTDEQERQISITNDQLPDIAVMQIKDTALNLALESLDVITINSSHTVRVCDDKALTHLYLVKEGVPTPSTLIAPERYPGQPSRETIIVQSEDIFGYPVVVKATKGSFGKEVFRANNREELLAHIDSFKDRAFLLQRYIATPNNQDFRLQVIDGKMVAAVARQPSERGEFRANLTLGASGIAIDPHPHLSELAIRASKAVGAITAGVDIVVDQQGSAYVLEVNSNAHFRRISEITGIDVALCLAKSIRRITTEDHLLK